jgi:MoaA/NifB/PqqE/SkfB family radical SAM enzyme
MYNYIAVFLTFACNLKCSYCINAHSSINRKRKLLSGDDWITHLSRIVTRPDLPITFGGGEPTLHPDFYYIVNELYKKNVPMDLLTNCQFDVSEFMENVSPNIFKRDAPYASIRVSYHPETMDMYKLIDKVHILSQNNYHIGIWAVNHPKWQEEINRCWALCNTLRIDFRLKEFLGEYEGKLYGTYKYPDACNSDKIKTVECKTSELIVGPNGDVHVCHASLYKQWVAIGNITDLNFSIKDEYHSCFCYGACNPCDIKLKFDRFQREGHCSVSIKEIK